MTTVRMERVRSGPPERVWHALTRPDALAAWFWPEQFDTTVTVDLRAGGKYRIAAGSPAMAVSGRYREVTPPKRLVFTWRWDGDDAESLVTIDLATSARAPSCRCGTSCWPTRRPARTTPRAGATAWTGSPLAHRGGEQLRISPRGAGSNGPSTSR